MALWGGLEVLGVLGVPSRPRVMGLCLARGGVYDGAMEDHQRKHLMRKVFAPSRMKEAAESTEVAVSVKFNTVEIRREIHNSGVCYLALEMAKTGERPVRQEGGKIVWEQMSEAAHIDMVKFIVRKVLPDIKEVESAVDRKALDRWAEVIAAEAEPVEG